MFQAVVDPVAGNLALSALVACIPLAAFFIMLVGVKAKAHVSALVALVVALVVAIFAFGMPADLAALSGLQGACYGAFPIVFIIIMAVWFYEVTVVSGRSEDLKSLFDIVGGGDIRIQAVLVAFCFGGLLEALAGFGAPIAITATMILALGVKPPRQLWQFSSRTPLLLPMAQPVPPSPPQATWLLAAMPLLPSNRRSTLPLSLATRHRSSLSLFLCWLS